MLVSAPHADKANVLTAIGTNKAASTALGFDTGDQVPQDGTSFPTNVDWNGLYYGQVRIGDGHLGI